MPNDIYQMMEDTFQNCPSSRLFEAMLLAAKSRLARNEQLGISEGINFWEHTIKDLERISKRADKRK